MRLNPIKLFRIYFDNHPQEFDRAEGPGWVFNESNLVRLRHIDETAVAHIRTSLRTQEATWRTAVWSAMIDLPDKVSAFRSVLKNPTNGS